MRQILTLYVVSIVVLITSCENRYQKEINELQSSYWRFDTVRFVGSYDSSDLNNEKIEKTIHYFSSTGYVSIYDLNGKIKNTFKYTTKEKDGSVGELSVNDHFKGETTYRPVIYGNGYMEFWQNVNTSKGSVTQKYIFYAITDSSLIKRIQLQPE